MLVEKFTGCAISGSTSLVSKLYIRKNYILVITKFCRENGLMQPPATITARCQKTEILLMEFESAPSITLCLTNYVRFYLTV